MGINEPTEAQIRNHLSLIKSSFAILAAGGGSYVQVAGGPDLFVLEFRDEDDEHFRARQPQPVAQAPQGSELAIPGTSLTAARNELFLLDQVAEVFCAFAAGKAFPSYVEWQPRE